jgi:Fur family ferric uptake transcriptional regulator
MRAAGRLGEPSRPKNGLEYPSAATARRVHRIVAMELEPASGTGADIAITEPLCAVFRRQLKAEGLKYTPERAHVLDAIIRLDDLFEAEQLIDELRKTGRRVSKATIYRTIRLLQDAGIIQRVLTDNDQGVYQLAYGQRPADLLIRLDTREAIPIEAPELVALRDAICRRLGLKAKGHRLQIFAVAEDEPSGPDAIGGDEG